MPCFLAYRNCATIGTNMNKLISTNPANYEVLGEVEFTSKSEIVDKVKKANAVKKDWKNLGLKGRERES